MELLLPKIYDLPTARARKNGGAPFVNWRALWWRFWALREPWRKIGAKSLAQFSDGETNTLARRYHYHPFHQTPVRVLNAICLRRVCCRKIVYLLHRTIIILENGNSLPKIYDFPTAHARKKYDKKKRHYNKKRAPLQVPFLSCCSGKAR